ncbi:hypothetical protein TRVL_02711 [Trypanosoma vivax]|nr:hypothetical protein TRVL_02711 [Trypanosoma vivax]
MRAPCEIPVATLSLGKPARSYGLCRCVLQRALFLVRCADSAFVGAGAMARPRVTAEGMCVELRCCISGVYVRCLFGHRAGALCSLGAAVAESGVALVRSA